MPGPIETKLVDKRIVQRYIAKGRVDEKEYEAYIKALPDLSDQAVPVVSDMDDDFDDLDGADEPSGTQG